MEIVALDAGGRDLVFGISTGMAASAIANTGNQKVGTALRLPRIVAFAAIKRGVFGVGKICRCVPNTGDAYRGDLPSVTGVFGCCYFVASGTSATGEQAFGNRAGLVACPGQRFLLLLTR